MSNRKIIIFFLLIFSSIQCFSATIVVTNNADSGPGCLRDAIAQATLSGGGVIGFNLPNTMAGRTITLYSPLPALPSNLTIDAGSQAGTSFELSNAKVAIVYQTPVEQDLSGFSIINQDNVTISGLYIKNVTNVANASKQYYWKGIDVEGGSNINVSDNVITGFYFPLTDNWQIYRQTTTNITLMNNFFGIDVDGETLSDNAAENVPIQNLYGIIDIKNNLFAGGLNVGKNSVFPSTNTAAITISNNKIGVDYAIKKSITESYGLSLTNSNPNDVIIVQDNIIDNEKGAAAVYMNALSKTVTMVRNYIGTDNTLTQNLATSARGIYIDYCNNAQIMIGDGIKADANYITGCKPVEINHGSRVAISENSFFCTINEYPMYDYSDPTIPTANILTLSNSSLSGGATANATIELFYSDKCNTCSPQTYFATVTSTPNGQFFYNGNLTGGVIASATLNGYTSEFTTVNIDSSKVKVTNACSDNDNGTITGMLPYSATNVQWVNKNGVIVGNSTDLSAKPGVYKLVIGNGSCQVSSAYYQIKTHFDADVSHLASSNSTCGNNNGSLTGIAIKNNDAQTPTLAWNDGNGKSWGSALALTNVPAGNYSLTVTTADKACNSTLGPFAIKNSDGVVITETAELVQFATCGKSDGSVTNIQISGGTGNYKYIWWNEEQKTVGTQKDLLNQPSGTYQLQVTDGSACGAVYSANIRIGETNGVTIDETAVATTNATCEMSNGSITGIKITGATTYTWTDATGKTYPTPTPDISKISAGTYTLTASGSTCSTNSKPYVITQPAPTRFSGYVVGQGEPCFGKNNGTLTVVIDNNVKSVRWLTPQNVSLTQTSISNLAAGTYQLFLTDQNGCEGLYITVTLTTTPQFVIAGQGSVTNSECDQSTGSINGLLFTGGLPPYNYEWTDAGGNLVGTNTNSLTGIPGGIYGLKVTDAACGLVTETYTVLDNTVDIPIPLVSGLQLCSSGNAMLKVTNPDPKAIYRLYNSPTSTNPIQEQAGGQFMITVDKNTSFYITEVNGSCESARAEVKVVVGLSVLNIANTFTPNGDGHNDYWTINNIENYPAAFVQVFNRYGQKVYESKGYAKPFDGTYNGKALPAGAYYYIINLSSGCNLLAGSVTIIR